MDINHMPLDVLLWEGHGISYIIFWPQMRNIFRFAYFWLQDLPFPVDPKAVLGGLKEGHLVYTHVEKTTYFFWSSPIAIKVNSKLLVRQTKSFYSSRSNTPFLINCKKKMEWLFFHWYLVQILYLSPLLRSQVWDKEEEGLKICRWHPSLPKHWDFQHNIAGTLAHCNILINWVLV